MPERSRHDGRRKRQRPGVRVGEPHRWQRHGAYSLLRMAAKGSLDGRVTAAQSVKAVALDLATDLGSTWEHLSTQQRLLVEQIALKAVAMAQMAGYALGTGEAIPKEWLTWSNSLRLDLCALGLEKRQKQVIDIVSTLAALPPDRTPPRAAEEATEP